MKQPQPEDVEVNEENKAWNAVKILLEIFLLLFTLYAFAGLAYILG